MMPSRCPLLAQSGHPDALNQCPLLGVKRTLVAPPPMSAFDPKRTWRRPAKITGSERFKSLELDHSCAAVGVVRNLTSPACMQKKYRAAEPLNFISGSSPM